MYSQDDYVTLIQCNQDRRRYRHLARQEPCVSCFDACGSRRRSDTYCLSLRLSLSLSLGWLGPYQVLLPFLYISSLFSLSRPFLKSHTLSLSLDEALLHPSSLPVPAFSVPLPAPPGLFFLSLSKDFPFPFAFPPKPPLTSAALFISYY